MRKLRIWILKFVGNLLYKYYRPRFMTILKEGRDDQDAFIKEQIEYARLKGLQLEIYIDPRILPYQVTAAQHFVPAGQQPPSSPLALVRKDDDDKKV